MPMGYLMSTTQADIRKAMLAQSSNGSIPRRPNGHAELMVQFVNSGQAPSFQTLTMDQRGTWISEMTRSLESVLYASTNEELRDTLVAIAANAILWVNDLDTRPTPEPFPSI